MAASLQLPHLQTFSRKAYERFSRGDLSGAGGKMEIVAYYVPLTTLSLQIVAYRLMNKHEPDPDQ